MHETFDHHFVIYDRDTVRTYRQSHPSQNVWEQEDRIITSIDLCEQVFPDVDARTRQR